MKKMTLTQMEQINGSAAGCGSALVGFALGFITLCSGVGALGGLLGMGVAFDQMARNCDVNESIQW